MTGGLRHSGVLELNTHLEQLKATVKQAWLTLSMLPDPDARFRRAFGSSWCLPVVQDPNTAYGSTPASWLGTPSARDISTMEAVFEWLSWLRGVDGEDAIRRIGAWALGQPIWKIAQRERCSERTIHNRIDRSIAKISAQFKDEKVKIEVIEEPEPRPERIRGFSPPPDNTSIGGVVEPGKVFISGGEKGVGFFMFRGERYKSSYFDGKAGRR